MDFESLRFFTLCFTGKSSFYLGVYIFSPWRGIACFPYVSHTPKYLGREQVGLLTPEISTFLSHGGAEQEEKEKTEVVHSDVPYRR